MKHYKKIILGLLSVMVIVTAGYTAVVSAQTVTVAENFRFYTDLTVGSRGDSVVALQTFLENRGFLVMPVGVAKGYFGPITRAAVAKYQAANGIMPTAGYFGPITRAHVNSVLASGTPTPNPNPNPGNDDDDLSGGDGDFNDFDILGNPNNEDLEEGQDTDVLAFEFEANDSDLRVERLDLFFAEPSSDTRPWRVFDEIALLGDDDDELVTIDASDEDNWDEGEDDEYSIRMEDIDEIVREGDTARFTVNVTAQDSIDDDEMDQWKVWIAEDGLRAMNAEGIDVYEGDSDDLSGAADERTFDLQEAEEGDLNITVDSDTNEDVEVEVSEDDETEDVLLYTAQVESQDGTNNIEEVTVDIDSLDSTDLSAMINTLYLYIDGEEVGSESVDGTSDSVTFDDIDVDLEEDEEVDFEVRADVESTEDGDNYSNGDGVQVTAIEINFVDENDDDQTATDNTAGGEITFSTDALSIDFVSKSASVNGNIDDQGEYYIRFKVTAPDESDIYIPNGAGSSTATNTGAYFQVLGTNNQQITVDIALAELDLTSGGSDEGGYLKVSKGNTATFELHVVVDNGGQGARGVKVALEGIDYNTRAVTAGLIRYTAGIDEEYRTSSVLLQNADAN